MVIDMGCAIVWGLVLKSSIHEVCVNHAKLQAIICHGRNECQESCV